MMTKRLPLILLFLIAHSTFGALVVTNSVLLQSVNGTNSGSAITLQNVIVPSATFGFYNGGLTATNDVRHNIQFSLDGVTFVTLTNFFHTRTNAGSETFAPNLNPITIYIRDQVVTTNATTVSSTIIKTQ